MKVKQEYILRKVADSYVVLPIGQATVAFNGMMTLNESGALMWELLENGSSIEALACKLTEVYNVSFERARKDAEEFVDTLIKIGCIEE